jgi:putative ABC transport system substrate-binding protein
MKIRTFAAILLVLAGLSPAMAVDITVAVVKSAGALPYDEVLEGFRQESRRRSVGIFVLPTEEDMERLERQISLRKPDFIYCLGAKALEQTQHIRDIPKIFSLITYSAMQAWPDREDIFGVTLDLAPLSQLEHIRRALPESRRIGLLYDPRQNRKIIDDAKRIALSMGMTIVAYPVSSILEIPSVLKEMENKIDLLLALYDSTNYQPEAAKYILMQTLRKKIPLVGFSPTFAKAGALLALYGDYEDMGRQAARLMLAVADRQEHIERIMRPRKVRTAINEKVARAMRTTFPPQFLKNIDRIY